MGGVALAGARTGYGIFTTRRRDGVITTATPGMTAENPINSIPRAGEGAVDLDGLQEIVRAARFIAASHAGAGDGFEDRIEKPLIETDQYSDQETEEACRWPGLDPRSAR